MKQVTSKFTSMMESTLRSYVPRMTINGVEVTGDIMHGLAITLGSCGADNSLTGGVVFVPSFTATLQNCTTYLQDREIKLEMGLVLADGTVEYLPMGYFTVDKPSVSKYTTSITAYGRLMSKMGANYTSALAYPTTVQNVASEIATRSGVAVEFKGFTTEKQLTVSKSMGLVSYRDALGSIAGLIGGYVTENADGNIVICKYTNTPVVTVDTSRCYAYPTHHDVEWEGTGIEITVPQEIKETEEEQPPEVKYTYGSPINVIYANVWMNNTAFEAVKSNLIGFKYMPSEVNFLGDLRLEPWDSIKVTDGADDAGFNVPCMNIVHTWDGGLVTQITAPANTTAEQSGAFAGAISQAVEEIKAQIMRVGTLIADKVSTQQLDAVSGKIDNLVSNQIIAGIVSAMEISANYIKGGTLDADLVDADAIATKVIASDELKANYAHIANGYIDNANIDAIQINKINGNPIVEGSILAEALAGHMASTLGGNKFIYQADPPSGTEWKVGDTWFKTVTESGNVSASNMYVWSGSQWVMTPLDSTVLRAGTIGAREISAEYEYAGIVYADKIIVGSKESPKGGLNDQIDRFISTDTSKAYTKGVPQGANYTRVQRILGETIDNFEHRNLIPKISRVEGDIVGDYEYSRSATTSEKFVRFLFNNKGDLSVGDTVTISADIKTNGYVTSVDMFIFDANTKSTKLKRIPSSELSSEYQRFTFTTTIVSATGADWSKVNVRFDNNGTTVDGTEAMLYVRNPKLEKSSTATMWTPAPEDGLLIDATPTNVTSSNGQSLNVNYGTLRSAGNVHDELDLVNGKIIRRVGQVDLGTLTWIWQSTWASWYADFDGEIKRGEFTSSYINGISGKYAIECQQNLTTNNGLTNVIAPNISNSPTLRLFCKTTSQTEKPTGILNYELAEPIEEEINVTGTLLPVEEGGTITFNNMGDDYGLQVPLSSTNEWWYLASSVRMDSFDSSTDAKIDNTVASVGESIQSVKDDVGSVSTRVESLDSITTTQTSQIKKLGEELLTKSLLAQGYATIDNGTLTLGYSDNEWKLVARGEGIDLMYGSTTVGTFGKYGTNGSQLKANNSELQTVRFRSTQGGTLGLVTSSDGHVTLKEVR